MNNFGTIFRVSVFGESHGPKIGLIVDGVPAGIPISPEDFAPDIARRKPGATGTTTRTETDEPLVESGVFNGFTTGAPISISFLNSNTKSVDYEKFREVPRPGHADFVARTKFKGFEDFRGGGHFSGRLTLLLVAAGVVAKKILNNIQIEAKLIEAGGMSDIELAIRKAQEANDSIGGIVACTATNLPIGLGEPFFDSAESVISHLVFAIPAVKAIGFGSGFKAAGMFGSEHNDAIIDTHGNTSSNNAGGVVGGITNGNPLYFEVVFKPTSSTPKTQHTLNLTTGKTEDFVVKGRHDLCIALRAPVIVEAVTAIALADLMLLHQSMK